MFEKEIDTSETQRIDESLRVLGARIDELVTNAGVPWLFNDTKEVSDGTYVMLVHRKSETENDYWVRHHTDKGLAKNNLRGKAYEEWRWDAEQPEKADKQEVIIFDVSRQSQPYTIKRGFDADDVNLIGSRVDEFEKVAGEVVEEYKESDG